MTMAMATETGERRDWGDCHWNWANGNIEWLHLHGSEESTLLCFFECVFRSFLLILSCVFSSKSTCTCRVMMMEKMKCELIIIALPTSLAFFFFLSDWLAGCLIPCCFRSLVGVS
jgi:hypothetical protein